MQPEPEYAFRHALLEDVAYASLVRSDRQCLHLAVAEALERVPPRKELALATAEQAQGHVIEAHRLGQVAQAVVRYLADHAPAGLRASFLAPPKVRAALHVPGSGD